MQQLGVAAILLLLGGTFPPSEGLKESQYERFDWNDVLDAAKHAVQEFYTYYRYYKYVRFALDAFSGPDGSCQFDCHKPIPRPGHRPSSNGCGSHALGFVFNTRIPLITDCCDQHDRCYDTCGQKKRDCDDKFHSCLKNICRNPLNLQNEGVMACDVAVSMTFEAVVFLGCKPYLASQRAACLCLNEERTDL